MNKPKNAINWFEIPVTDFERARKFYSTVLGAEIGRQDWNGAVLGFLPGDQEGVTGALIQTAGAVPSDKGSRLFLNGGEDLAVPLSRVEKAGGKVLLQKMGIGEYGSIGQFKDTEGNVVFFHDAT